ncbi:PorT family protein [Hymenobacter aerilatus]|uniref:PorT family protein n=1 Tax=Hymenobacter aerilatus TaxID=2932251 RepID=A0A8T9SRC5_9BACT|nr:porin family protein [Hymenobacter aerilatus]UOR04297.1 PorT family protein [Hymenobacter aerilatus]
MKKIALLSLALVSAASVAQAQSGPRLGIRVGGTLANINGKNRLDVGGNQGDSNFKLGYNAGISYQIPLSSDGFWTLAPELLYNRKGFENSYESKNASSFAGNTDIDPARRANLEKFKYENKRTLAYIELPIPVRINTAPGGSGLYFELGPQVGYMVTSEQRVTKEYKYTSTSNTSDFKDKGPKNTAKEDLQSFDIGALAGVGYQTAGGFSLGVRYTQGIKSMLNDQKAFNQSFTAQVGYLVPWGK